MKQEFKEHPYYGKPVLRHQEEAYIRSVLHKYRHDEVSEVLKEKIWNELQMAKFEGRVTIPFKVVMRRDVYGLYPEYIEIILDTKL